MRDKGVAELVDAFKLLKQNIVMVIILNCLLLAVVNCVIVLALDCVNI
mgnify:CR=1 FL=1